MGDGAPAGAAQWLLQQWQHWSSYRPSDFLMFAPRTYWRLFELHNEAWWPWPWAALALGSLGLVVLAVWPAAEARAATPLPALRRLVQRTVLLGLAGAWWFIAVSFHLDRYASINAAAPWLAAACALQGVLLVGLAWRLPPGIAAGPRARGAALALGAWALLAHPLLAVAQGRPWMQSEVFGLAPDPTLMATLAVLLLLRPWRTQAAPGAAVGVVLHRAAWWLALALMALGAGALATMEEPQAWVLLAAALLAGWGDSRARAKAAGAAPRPPQG